MKEKFSSHRCSCIGSNNLTEYVLEVRRVDCDGKHPVQFDVWAAGRRASRCMRGKQQQATTTCCVSGR